MARNMEEIAALLKQTRFKSRFIGGVDEDDVWSKLGRMQQEYEALINALQEQCNGVVYQYQARIQNLQQRLRDVEGQRELPDTGAQPVAVWEQQPARRAAPQQAQRQAQPYAAAKAYDSPPPQAQPQPYPQPVYDQRRGYPDEADGYSATPNENGRAQNFAPHKQGLDPRYTGSAPYSQPPQYEQATPYVIGSLYSGSAETAATRDATGDMQRRSRTAAYAMENSAPWHPVAIQPSPERQTAMAAQPAYEPAQEPHAQPAGAPYGDAGQAGNHAPLSQMVRYHLQCSDKVTQVDRAMPHGKAGGNDARWLAPVAQALVSNRHG